MPGRFPAITLSKYPHLSPADAEVATAFLVSSQNTLDRIDYDVRVGSGIPAPSGFSSNLLLDWRALTQLRIDAVGYSPSVIWIIEFKPRMNVAALGQLSAYAQLYSSSFSPGLPLRKVFVTFETVPDLISVYASNGISVLVVPRSAT